MKVKQQPVEIATAEKKRVFINLPFKGDSNAERISRRLSTAIESTYNAATLRVSFNTMPIVKQQLKDNLPSCKTSYCVYLFECSCRALYVGRTTRRLLERIGEHNPAWLRSGEKKVITSAIVEHLAETGHHIDTRKAFRVIHKVSTRQPKGVRFRSLAAAEAISIRLLHPDLCAQKRFVKTLKLPWSVTNVTPNTEHRRINSIPDNVNPSKA